MSAPALPEGTSTPGPGSLLLDRLHAAGMTDVVTVTPAAGGQAATAGLARRRDGTTVFVKAFDDAPADDVFAVEAEGLTAHARSIAMRLGQ